jgi:hypothetical protein
MPENCKMATDLASEILPLMKKHISVIKKSFSSVSA